MLARGAVLPSPVALLPSCWAQRGVMPGFGEVPSAVSLLWALERCSADRGQRGAKVSGRRWVQHMHPLALGNLRSCYVCLRRCRWVAPGWDPSAQTSTEKAAGPCEVPHGLFMPRRKGISGLGGLQAPFVMAALGSLAAVLPSSHTRAGLDVAARRWTRARVPGARPPGWASRWPSSPGGQAARDQLYAGGGGFSPHCAVGG